MQSTIEASSANDLVGKYVIMKVTSSTTGETSYIAGTCDYVLLLLTFGIGDKYGTPKLVCFATYKLYMKIPIAIP